MDSVPDGYLVWWDGKFGGDRRAMEYEGLTRAEAEDRASANSVEFVRVVDLDQSEGIALRPDLRPGRLNLLVHRGLVARAGFG